MNKYVNLSLHKVKTLRYYLLTIMRIFLLLITIGLSSAFANSSYSQTKIDINVDNITIEDLFKEIQGKSEYVFFYKDDVLNRETRISLNLNNAKLSAILDKAFINSDLTYKIDDRQVIIKRKIKEEKAINVIDKTIQGLSLTGVVLDNTGQPLPGANVLEKGTTNGAQTDFDGKFSLEIADENAVIIISYLGFLTQEIAVNGQTTLTITLQEDTATLDEVVVVGYGTKSKVKVTSAISTVKSTDLTRAPITSFEEGLAGQIAGVQIIQTSGSPGGSSEINIRGVATLTAGSQPLIVIDGFPSEDFNLGSINPADIESIDVLKDAASAAIYGSRGSNGVIIVTTKKGKHGDVKVTYDGFVGMQKVANIVDTQDAYERANFVATANINEGKPPSPLFQPYVDGTPGLTNTNWQDEIFRNALIQSHTITFSGATDKTNYFVSGGYFDQDGIVIGSDYKRYNFRSNLNFDISEKFKAGFNLSTSYSTQNNISEGDHKGNGIVLTSLIANPVYSPYNSDGSLNLSGDMILGARANGLAQTENPVAMALLNEDEVTNYDLLAGGFLEYQPIEGLSFKTYLGTNYSNANEKLYSPETVGGYKVLASDKQASGAYYSGQRKNWVWENTGFYHKAFDDVHNLDILLGITYQTESTESTFPNPLASTLVNQGGVNTTIYPLFEEEWSLISYLGRVNYDYKHKYILSASMRYDGSSRFGNNTKWGWFPSVSGAWRISKEDFFKSETISELKLRASWGITGNNSIPNYGSIPLLSSANYINSIGLAPSTSPNENLSWEQTNTLDIGFEIGLFKNKLGITADYYYAITDDLLLDVPVPAHSGNTSSLRNIGKVQNTGFEFTVGLNNIMLGAVAWSGNFNISTNKNEVLELGPDQDRIVNALHITEIGKPMGSYYIYRLEGLFETQEQIDNAPIHPEQGLGDYRFADLNGDGFITGDDREIGGDFFPDYTWGFSNTFKYKNFDFNFAFQGKEGYEIYNGTGFFIRNLEGWGNGHADINNYYTTDNPSGPYAHPGKHVKTYERSKLLVEDGSYIRLRSISFGYTLTEDVLKNTFMDRLKVYVSSKNLFTITNYTGLNPEVSSRTKSFSTGALQPGVDYGAYPIETSVVFGVNLEF